MLTLNNEQKPAESHAPGGNSHFDLEAIIEQVWKDLGGTASRSDIRSVVIEVSPRYADARIMTYVPIFMGKEVRKRMVGSA